MSRILFFLLVLVGGRSPLIGQTGNHEEVRRQALERINGVLWPLGNKEVEITPLSDRNYEVSILEAGDSAIPILDKAMDGSTHRSVVAAYGLALSGSEASLFTLRSKFNNAKKHWIKAGQKQELYFGLAASGSVEDRALLINALKGPHDRDWTAVESAILSLGVLREKNAISLLNSIKSKNKDSITGGTASIAVRWIKDGYYKTAIAEKPGKDNDLLMSILECGIPLRGQQRFFDPDGKKIWSLQDKTWNGRDLTPEDSKEKNMPIVSLKIYRPKTTERAIVTVEVMYGSADGKEYLYSLKVIGGRWKVVGITLELIA